MGTHWWFPNGRPGNSAAAAVLALLAAGLPVVEPSLVVLLEAYSLEELQQMAAFLPCGC
jgi:hypothetical protein